MELNLMQLAIVIGIPVRSDDEVPSKTLVKTAKFLISFKTNGNFSKNKQIQQ